MKILNIYWITQKVPPSWCPLKSWSPRKTLLMNYHVSCLVEQSRMYHSSRSWTWCTKSWLLIRSVLHVVSKWNSPQNFLLSIIFPTWFCSMAICSNFPPCSPKPAWPVFWCDFGNRSFLVPCAVDCGNHVPRISVAASWFLYPCVAGGCVQLGIPEFIQIHPHLMAWLVVWNMFYFSIYWECHHPNWLSYFSEG